MAPTVRALPVLVLVLLLLLAGCGGSDPLPRRAAGLEAALASVADGPAGRARVEWGDTVRLRALAGAPAGAAALGQVQLQPRWAGVLGTGASTLTAGNLPRLAERTGIDPLAARSALTLGVPPRYAIRLAGSGVDGARVRKLLGDLGARAEGDLLALGPEGGVGLGRVGNLGLGGALDRVSARPGRVVLGPYAAPVREGLGPGSTPLLDAPEYAPVARCLGDVAAAELVPGRALHVGAVKLVGVGVATGPERICVAAADPSRIAARLRRALAPRTPEPATGRPVGELVARSRVSSAGDVVRVELGARPGRAAGLVFTFVANGVLGTWLGAPSPRGP